MARKKLYKIINEIIGEQIYKSTKEVNWEELIENYTLPEWFMLRYINKKEVFILMVRYQVLSENFIRSNLNNLLDNYSFDLTAKQKIPEDIIENNMNKLSIYSLSENQILSWDFIEKHRSTVEWRSIASRQPMINYEKSIEYFKSINKTVNPIPYLGGNYLSREYKKGKDWFIGYTFYDDLKKPQKYILQPESISSYIGNYQIVKVKVYWKDMITTKMAKNIEPIRIIKLPR